MSSVSCLPIRLEIGASRSLGSLLSLLHLGPVPLLFFALPGLPALGLSALCLVSLWQTWRRFVQRTARTSVIEVRVNGDREWFLRLADSTETTAVLINAVNWNWLMLLAFDTRRGRRRAVILPDAADRNARHRLRVFLNCLQ